jgi:hypothetical protein
LRGDILIGLHKFEMLSTDHVHYVLSQPEIIGSSPLPFYSVRAGQQRSGKILPSD